MIDPESIQKVVQQVVQGQITLQQAAESLISDSSPTSFASVDGEPLVDLVQRLGPPPADIAAAWCDQLRALFSESGGGVADHDLSNFRIGSDGQLRVIETVATESASARDWEAKPRDIESIIASFREQLGVDALPIETDAVEADKAPVQPEPTETPEDAPTESNSGASTRFRIATAVGIAACAAALFWIVRQNTAPTVADTTSIASVDSKPNVFSDLQAAFPSTRDQSRGGANERSLIDAVDESLSGPLQTLDQIEDLESLESTSEEDIARMESSEMPEFSLEMLVPSIPSDPAAPESSTEKSGKSDNTETGDSDDPDQQNSDQSKSAQAKSTQSNSFGDSMDDAAEETEPPQEIEQPTRSDITDSFRLPPLKETDSVVLKESLTAADIGSSLTLSFPTDISLAINALDSARWSVVDQRSDATVAMLELDDRGLTFAWTPQAQTSSQARLLHFGQLRSENGARFYLRPAILAEPWAIRLNLSDMRPTWDLQSTLPPAVSRISVDLGLPEETEMTWVQPVPADSPRRARGMVVVKPLDGESVNLAIQFDIRCGRKMSCRMRYAARLNSSMPWQLVSRPSLQQFADQLAVRSELISQEAERLQNVYSLAGSRGKRIIRVKQRVNDSLADDLRQFANSIAELQSLVAKVESGGTIQFRVWVQWPEQEQTVFSSITPPPT